MIYVIFGFTNFNLTHVSTVGGDKEAKELRQKFGLPGQASVKENGTGNCDSILNIFSPYNTVIKRSVNRLNQINSGNGKHCCLQDLYLTTHRN